jgi:glutathione peroxidase
VVKGDGTCELYKYLTSSDTNPDFAGDIKWNFTKFLIDRDGKVIARFEPRTTPVADEVVGAIEKALAAAPTKSEIQR